MPVHTLVGPGEVAGFFCITLCLILLREGLPLKPELGLQAASPSNSLGSCPIAVLTGTVLSVCNVGAGI